MMIIKESYDKTWSRSKVDVGFYLHHRIHVVGLIVSDDALSFRDL